MPSCPRVSISCVTPLPPWTQALTFPARVPSAAACHDTMKAVSKAILDQIGGSEPAISRSSSDRSISPRRNGIRGAPISSSRDDPLPNEGFPAPLPAITLPYELSLLDNLFLNPMAPHHKASDYTNGNKNRVCQIANEVRAGYNHANASESSYGAPPQGFPPGAFQGGYNKSLTGGGGSNGLGAYGMAAVGGAGGSTNAQSGTTDTSGFAQTQQAHGEMDPNGFDVFSFLMDEEGGLGGNNWDALEVPADFSLWS